MNQLLKYIVAVACIAHSGQAFGKQIPPELRVGRAGHAFDHVGGINNQAAAAATSGATIIYATGLGAFGYTGLPPLDQLAAQREAIREYNREAKRHGIELVLGYLCATSIVGLDAFDKNWSRELRSQFKTSPAEWRQMDRSGRPLASWYGGEYQPACMNHPDWRAYERFMVRQQLEAGHDGIFFDNPTVHPQGCYCEHCMAAFAKFSEHEEEPVELPAENSQERVEAIRRLADARPREFLKFRCMMAPDFLAHIRQYARTINPNALITCNNSLNSPDRLYAQCRTHAYNVWELSKVEDFVVVEDMVTQPRIEADGRTFEYGPTYKQLHAISHGKPIVAVTLVNDDYHTAPNLVRLAMAEAAAHNASYLSWPTWPEEQRQRMIAAIRPQADLLRRNERLLNDAAFRADLLLFLPFRRWVETDQCAASSLAAALTAANVQYKVVSEEDLDLPIMNGQPRVLVVESMSILTPTGRAAVEKFQRHGGQAVVADAPNWFEKAIAAIRPPSLTIDGPSTVRGIIRDQPDRTIVHLYNLHVQRHSSFEDQVTPATDLKLTATVPFQSVDAVTVHSADEQGTSGAVAFTAERAGAATRFTLTIPRLEISAIVVVEP